MEAEGTTGFGSLEPASCSRESPVTGDGAGTGRVTGLLTLANTLSGFEVELADEQTHRARKRRAFQRASEMRRVLSTLA